MYPAESCGLSTLSLHLDLVRGPLTEAHTRALAQAFEQEQDVYLVIPESR